MNRYDGSFAVRVRMVPRRGEAWAQFLTRVVLEEGDADDVDDTGGVTRDGTPSPSAPGVPPDDGRPYTVNGIARDNSGYRLPTSTAPSADGSPWLELFDPNGTLRVVLFDLSGNVSQETGTASGFESIPVPGDGVPGDWVLVMHHLDARNSWFLRTNLEVRPVDGQSLSGRVFEDLDCDGTDDVRVDPPLAGVRVQAVRTDVPGATPLFAVTDSLGAWRFDPVAPGTWSVSIVPGQPALLGRNASTPLPIVRTLAARQNLFGLDIGLCPVGTIGDRVWYDRDGDGQQSADEPGLPGVGVEILDAAGQILKTATTDADGAYRFDLLPPGDYTVRTVGSTIPSGFGPTTPESITLSLPAGGAIGTADFGYRPIGSVGDRVWRDDDGDAAQDEGEPGLPGVTVELRTPADVLLASQTTGADGRYLFTGLDAGTYVVHVLDATAPAGSQRTTPTDSLSATIPAGGSDVTLDFGYQPTGSVTGTVFRDGDGDGIRDPGEAPIGGVAIRLLTPEGLVIATTTTLPDGTYRFDGVPVGSYLVNVVEGNPILDGLTRTTPGQPVPVSVVAGAPTPPVDFGYRPSQDVSGRVWLDRDGDGVQDPEEPGLRDVSVELVDPSGNVRAFRTTSASGVYLFEDVPVGSWTVRVVPTSLPAGLSLTTPPGARPITVVEATPTKNVDFGYRGSATVGDRIWLDVNGNTLQDAGEPGIAGVVVDVVDALTSAPFGRRTTGTDGIYLVDGLPAGTYRLIVDESTLPATVVRTSPTASPQGSVAVGAQNLTLDVGYRFLGAIGDRVWLDVNGDRAQDAGEPGLLGVTLELFDANGAVIRTTSTIADGFYLFDGLADGTYAVRVVASTVPPGLSRTTPPTPTYPAAVVGGSTDLTRDFGYRPLVGTGSGSISGRVFEDPNTNGAPDSGEPGIPGAVVELVDPNGDVVATTTTGPDGSYVFDHLPDGAYTVRVAPGSVPAGLNPTTPTSRSALDRRRGRRHERELRLRLAHRRDRRPRLVRRRWRRRPGRGRAGHPGRDARTREHRGSGDRHSHDELGGRLPLRRPRRRHVRRARRARDAPDGRHEHVRRHPAVGHDHRRLDRPLEGLRLPAGRHDLRPRLPRRRRRTVRRTAREPGIPGAIVELVDSNGDVIATTTTGPDGSYVFDHLPDGAYTVRVAPGSVPAGLNPTTPTSRPAHDRRRRRRHRRELRLRLPHRRDRRPRLVRHGRRRRPGRGRAGHPGRHARAR